MRPDVVAETREWMERAYDDLREAECNLSALPPLVRGSVFHCQQAAEKALKAFLVVHQQPFRKTHDLEELGGAVSLLEPSLSEITDRAIELTPYAWRFRYPGAPVSPTMKEAREALDIARELYGAVLSHLPEEARP